jgi:hypothetical protein
MKNEMTQVLVRNKIISLIKYNLEKLSIESITSSIMSAIQSFMIDHIKGLNEDHGSLKEIIMCEMRNIESSNRYIVNIIETLPDKVNNLYNSSQTDDKIMFNAMFVDLHRKIEEVTKCNVTQNQITQNISYAVKNVATDVDRMWLDLKGNADSHLNNSPSLVKGVLCDLLSEINKDSIESKILNTNMQLKKINQF